MNELDLDQRLTDAFERLADHAPQRPDWVATTRRRVRQRRAAGVAALSAVSVAAAAAVAIPLGAFRDDQKTVAVAGAAACESTVTRAVLPEWARTGFSDPEPVMPFVRSASGNVVAILFGPGLAAPARPDEGNKVLWVWKELPAAVPDIHAAARLEGTGPVVTSGLPSPVGPSAVNLAARGCWRVTLSWPGGSDTIDLRATR
jgi:hypothetical protein